jgi:hypothetical protein
VFKNLKILSLFIAFAVILTSIVSCSANGTANQSTSPSSAATQGQSGSPGHYQPSNMQDVLNRAAEILGVPADQLTTAFKNATPNGFSGQPPAHSGQRPTPQPGQQPPAQSQHGMNMKSVFDKMAETLNVSSDNISNAFNQAEQELRK